MQKINDIVETLNFPRKYSQEVYAKTKLYQKKYGFQLGNGRYDTLNCEADAFKHTFGAADIALKSLTGISKKVTDFHELQQRNNPSHEENMDRWNNLEGRKIANEIIKKYGRKESYRKIYNGEMDDIIAEKVMQKMKNGELITNPYKDTRKFKDNVFMDTIFSIKNRVFHKNEVSMKDLDDPLVMDTFLDQSFGDEPMPNKAALDERVLTGELVYVSEYTRRDGTKVSGYYRSYPTL